MSISYAVREWFSFDATKISNIVNLYGNISDWDVTQVRSMNKLFANNLNGFSTRTFNSDLSKWTTTRVTNMAQMFNMENGPPLSEFNCMLTNFDTSKVTTMYAMFRNSNYNQDLSSFVTKNVVDLSYMFMLAHEFNQDLDWNTQKVK